jgi:hypothetical protein
MRLYANLLNGVVSAEWPARSGPVTQEVKALTGERVEVRFHQDGEAVLLESGSTLALRVRATKSAGLLAELTEFEVPENAATGFYSGRLSLNTDAILALLAASPTKELFQVLAALEWTIPGADAPEESDDLIFSLQRRTGAGGGDPLVMLTPWEWLKLRAPEANGFTHDDEAEELAVAGGSGSGDVVGPASAADNAIVRYNGTSGKVVQASGITIADGATGTLSGTNTGDQVNITGNAATVTTNANLTGPVTSIGNATSIANGAITNAMLANEAVANLSGTNTGDQTAASLGLVIGTNVQAYSANLATFAGIAPAANVQSLLNAADYAAIRTLLGLIIGTNVQAYSANLTTFAGIAPAANVQSLLNAADYAAMRTLLGLVIGTNVQAYSANLATFAGIAPAANVQSLLNAADYAAMRTLLGLVIGTNVQAYNANLTTFAGIAPSSNVQSLLSAADYAAIRTLLSLGSAALLASSEGANGSADAGKAIVFDASGGATISNALVVWAATGTYPYALLASDFLKFGTATLDSFLRSPTLTANREWLLPDFSGTLLVSGALGTGVYDALAVAIGSAGAPVLFNGAGGTPSSLTLTNATGLPTAGLVDDAVTLAKMAAGTAGNLITYDASGNPAVVATGTAGQVLTSNGAGAAPTMQTLSGGGNALTSNPLSQFAATTSAQLAGVISDETGSGALVFGNSPTLVTPNLGTPSAATLTNATGLPLAGITGSTSAPLGVGSLEVGHASDTTLARSSAGNLTVEGNLLYRAGGSFVGLPAEYSVALSDESTALTAGTAKVTFRMPFAMTLAAVRASVNTAPTGSTLVVDINESGSTILSTKLSIDATEKTSTTAATAAVISDTGLADDAEMTIDIDQIGSTIAGAGLKVTLIGTRA